eukprot:CAMPEP_0174282118 /NCGR_PEP_ID=MMETSP0809-20121228/2582_1 /TAXON_ID=73025 ORGANISM="Eutreptiella gymnastica-like, Strain CCMP1594" /NCGR_SAMPLE_ID=MMETSP0809 /ASSEMBLY_ACC=CAM_ASM_000658 /LENGTH=74 /DNA_ID=CAMNT_0015376111 /DNA_START=111 /DNA_END=332 /DNA_ORIENTATION=+
MRPQPPPLLSPPIPKSYIQSPGTDLDQQAGETKDTALGTSSAAWGPSMEPSMVCCHAVPPNSHMYTQVLQLEQW